ncbi:MAG TPA: hypothetical protein VHB02_01065 [Acidimicrobiales bacterium]|nr:hypothetical protein [Acidimicrobiales bacterium]
MADDPRSITGFDVGGFEATIWVRNQMFEHPGRETDQPSDGVVEFGLDDSI